MIDFAGLARALLEIIPVECLVRTIWHVVSFQRLAVVIIFVAKPYLLSSHFTLKERLGAPSPGIVDLPKQIQ